jgi:hypothetical protein
MVRGSVEPVRQRLRKFCPRGSWCEQWGGWQADDGFEALRKAQSHFYMALSLGPGRREVDVWHRQVAKTITGARAPRQGCRPR